MDKPTIREQIASEVHLTWQRWMAYMLTNLDDEHIARWKRQANTAYKDLPEQEKESDRAIADIYLSLIIEKAKGTKNPHPQQICVLTPGFTPKIKLNPDYLLFNEAIQAMIKEISDG